MNPATDRSHVAKQLQKENFRWATASTASFADVTGSAKDMPDHYDIYYGLALDESKAIPPQVQYDETAFNEKDEVFFDITRNIPNENCYFCHSTMVVDNERTEFWQHGEQNYSALGSVVDTCLAADGRALIHTIGRNQPKLMNAWIEKRIFPGAYPPTLREMMDILEPNNFSVLDVENLRLHYARTLEHWLLRYDDASDEVVEMFDPAFARAWRLYLCGSIAAFLYGSLQLFQVLFARGRDNTIPWSRKCVR